MTALLDDLKAAALRGDAEKVREIATEALVTISPSGALTDVADLAERTRELHALDARFDADEAVLRHLQDETLASKLETDLALIAPTVVSAATAIEGWAIPLLASLVAPPFSALLGWGLLIACKVAHAALTSWAEKRLKNVKLAEGRP